MSKKQKSKRFAELNSNDKAVLAAGTLVEKQASEVAVLDVAGLTSVTDAVVLATARNARHAKALADHLLEAAKSANLEYLGMEGYRGGEWVLVDLNDVIVHIFQEDHRRFYNLEGLWADAKPVSLEGGLPAQAPAKEESGG